MRPAKESGQILRPKQFYKKNGECQPGKKYRQLSGGMKAAWEKSGGNDSARTKLGHSIALESGFCGHVTSKKPFQNHSSRSRLKRY
ncbi:hypothetical protein [Desulfonatronum thioautotrophicum]|uniref:hypothetical protein n=1 Tax=Desulfonatronum thioautotrophicum TaxID=617001 RepID=UPI0012947938|nr:hypothetical protein [Desulfonatronum thioautotrophicum]